MNDDVLGPAFPAFGWVPAPRYLMRRNRILTLMDGAEPGRLLEIGPGAGALLTEFSRKGFTCEALEPSFEAREIAEKIVRSCHAHIPFHPVSGEDWEARFDCLFAFEVLEHIEEDDAALTIWRTWLRKGGRLVLSVPARMKLWTAGDEWAGHCRRYERDALIALVEASGFKVEHFECYGFPVTNITERVSAPLYRRAIRIHSGSGRPDRQQNNDRSGTDRGPHLLLFRLTRSFVGKGVLRLLYWAQSRFLRRDLGSGYLLVARSA